MEGIGEGNLKTRVPEAHTDYIISVISEEFGVIAIILILLLFLIFIYSVFKKVENETNITTRLILIGSASLILLQAMIHIGVNIRLFPTTGMTLPFLELWRFIHYQCLNIIWHNLKFDKRKVQI